MHNVVAVSRSNYFHKWTGRKCHFFCESLADFDTLNPSADRTGGWVLGLAFPSGEAKGLREERR